MGTQERLVDRRTFVGGVLTSPLLKRAILPATGVIAIPVATSAADPLAVAAKAALALAEYRQEQKLDEAIANIASDVGDLKALAERIHKVVAITLPMGDMLAESEAARLSLKAWSVAEDATSKSTALNSARVESSKAISRWNELPHDRARAHWFGQFIGAANIHLAVLGASGLHAEVQKAAGDYATISGRLIPMLIAERKGPPKINKSELGTGEHFEGIRNRMLAIQGAIRDARATRHSWIRMAGWADALEWIERPRDICAPATRPKLTSSAQQFAEIPGWGMAMLGADWNGAGFTVYRWRSNCWEWIESGSAVRLAADGKGYIYTVNAKNEVHRFNLTPAPLATETWQFVPGCTAADVAVSRSGELWALNLESAGGNAGGGHVYHYPRKFSHADSDTPEFPNVWENRGGGGTAIAIHPDQDEPYIVNKLGRVLANASNSSGNPELSGEAFASDIGIGQSQKDGHTTGRVWAVGHERSSGGGNSIYRLRHNGEWEQVSDYSGLRIAGGPREDAFVKNSHHYVHRAHYENGEPRLTELSHGVE